MADRFQACLAETLKWEGGYSDDAHDPGGKTMKGVIQSEYDAYRRRKGLPTQWVKLISDDELRDIYRSSYWVPVRADELPAGLDLEVWDFAVNSGPVTAVRKLQQVLGLTVDGHIGTQTIDAVHSRGDVHGLVENYMEARRSYLRNLRTFQYFGTGWMRRCDGIEHSAMASAGNIIAFVPPADLPKPEADPDVQSASQGRSPPEKPAPPVATEATLALGGSGGLATGFANVFGRVAASGKTTATGFLMALLQEPIILVAGATLFGAAATYLWRQKHSA